MGTYRAIANGHDHIAQLNIRCASSSRAHSARRSIKIDKSTKPKSPAIKPKNRAVSKNPTDDAESEGTSASRAAEPVATTQPTCSHRAAARSRLVKLKPRDTACRRESAGVS